MNGGAVISRESTQEKLFFISEHTYPRFSILDPETTYTLPQRQFANGVIDAFVQVLEQYMTYEVHSPLQDRFSEGILRTLVEEAPKVMANPRDYDARANIMWCATNGLNGWIACGVPQDWASHMIGHELTALHGVDHGQSLAIVMPGMMQHQRLRKRAKLLQYAARVWDIAAPDDDARIAGAIARTEEFFRSLGTGTRLRDYDIPGERRPRGGRAPGQSQDAAGRAPGPRPAGSRGDPRTAGVRAYPKTQVGPSHGSRSGAAALAAILLFATYSPFCREQQVRQVERPAPSACRLENHHSRWVIVVAGLRSSHPIGRGFPPWIGHFFARLPPDRIISPDFSWRSVRDREPAAYSFVDGMRSAVLAVRQIVVRGCNGNVSNRESENEAIDSNVCGRSVRSLGRRQCQGRCLLERQFQRWGTADLDRA